MNNKGADQNGQMCRLVCAFVVNKPSKTGFLWSRPKIKLHVLCSLIETVNNANAQVLVV